MSSIASWRCLKVFLFHLCKFWWGGGCSGATDGSLVDGNVLGGNF